MCACSKIAWKRRGTGVYQDLARRAHQEVVATTPLSEPEADRKRVRAPEFNPLVIERMTAGDIAGKELPPPRDEKTP